MTPTHRRSLLALCLISIFFIGSASFAADTITLKLGHCNAPGETDPYQMTAVEFSKAIEEIMPGQFKVEIFPSRQLGDEKEMLEALSFGTLDMGVITNSSISRISLPFQVNDMPFIYSSEAAAHKVLDGPVGDQLLKTLESKNISGLSIEEIARGMLPFFLVDVCMLMAITFVPWVSLWLPQLVLG